MQAPCAMTYIFGGITVSQIKQSTAPSRKKKSSGGKNSNHWQSKSGQNRTRLIAILSVIAVLLLPAGWFIDRSGLFSMHGDQEDSVNSALIISEIMSENISMLVTEEGNVPDWIELVNAGNSELQIGKYALMLESTVNRIFTFPDYTLKPGEYLLVHADGLEGASAHPWRAPFKLPASGNDTLMLLNAHGATIDSVRLPELQPNQSYMRADDGSWAVSDMPSPGGGKDYSGERQLPVSRDAVEITEVMAANTLYPGSSGVPQDYIEIHNTSDKTVDLEGWYLSDSIDKLRRWTFPKLKISAGEYIVVYCTGESAASASVDLCTNFKLSSNGETVFLSRPDGQTVSMVRLPELLSDQAYSLCDGAWTKSLGPTPGMANSRENAGETNFLRFGDRENALRLNELSASPDKQPYDWVEIYNGTSMAIDLGGYGLSDNTATPRKWQFPAGTVIQPDQYMGIFLSGEATASMNGYPNADFSLSVDGCYSFCLSDPDGSIIDAVYVPDQYGGVSYGRVSGQNSFCFFEKETPMAENAGDFAQGRAEEPAVSVGGGLFKTGDSFSVELSAPAGSRIYYTLDCSDPDESSTPYTGPIRISETTILRSRAYLDNHLPSYTDTQSYLFDVVNDSAYVVSIVSDMDNLSGEGGLLTDYTDKIEVEGHAEVFTPDGKRAVSQGAGLALHGQDSRKKSIKSFDVIARSIYGNNRFDYPLFSHRDYTSYQSFLLRPSGEDQNMSFMRDSVLTSLMRGSSVMFQEHELAVMYLNGLYYSMCYMRERINEHSICQFEGWEGLEDDIDLIKLHDTVNQGSNETFEALLSWVKNNDTTTEAAYQYIADRIDIQNYIEYMALQIFVGNTDTLNVRRYRCDMTDGKWRWALYDLDWAFYNDTNSIKNWLTPGGTGAGKRTDNTLFIGCMKNPIFREQFLEHFAQQMATTFSTENVMARFSEQYSRLQPLMPQFREQWGFTLKAGTSKVIEYAQERPTKILNYFKDAFGFSNVQMQEIFGPAIEKIQEYKAK